MDLWVKPVILNPSDPVILSKAKDLILLRVDSAKSLRTSSVKDLRSLRDSSPAAQNDKTHSTDFWDATLGSDRLREGFDLTPEPIIAGQSSLDLLAGVHHGRMVLSAERLTDGR